jgi:hypothetical protein
MRRRESGREEREEGKMDTLTSQEKVECKESWVITCNKLSMETVTYWWYHGLSVNVNWI